MNLTINQIYKKIYKDVDAVYEVFKNFFGESYTDLQRSATLEDIRVFLDGKGVKTFSKDDPYNESQYIPDDIMNSVFRMVEDSRSVIYVWWPKVTVTNEFDKSIVIQDLYAQIKVNIGGKIPYEFYGFLLNRATYSEEQFRSNYLHSHISDIPKRNFREFKRPCLGTGPIRNTIATLHTTNDEVTWMLFCQELAMYVTVESIHGRPYHRLEEVNKGLGSGYTGYSYFKVGNWDKSLFNYKATIKDFIKYYIENGHLVIGYRDGKFTSGMSYYDYIIDVSNTFIDFYNKKLKTTEGDVHRLFRYSFLNKVLAANGKFHSVCSSNTFATNELAPYQNKPVLTFKGREITTKILQAGSETPITTTVLNHGTAMYILKGILNIINFRYKNEYRNKDKSEAATATVDKKVLYL